MPKYLNILIAYFILALSLAFMLKFSAPLLLFVAQPALLIVVYWRKLSKYRAKNLPNIVLLAFVIGYGFELFEHGYGSIVDYEKSFRKSELLNLFFIVAFSLSFVPTTYFEKGETEL
jgi:hypothetical protein